MSSSPTSAPTSDPPSQESKIYTRLENLLAEEFGLSPFKRAVAKQFIKKAFTDQDGAVHFNCIREWLRKRLSNSRVQPLSTFQRGCPQLFPKLRAKAFWDTKLFPFVKEFEASFPLIRQELLQLRDAERSGFQPYRAPSWASKRKAKDGVGSISHDGGSWNVLYLQLHNIDFSINCDRCPVTSKLLSNVPRAYGHAFFSAMAPGTHITPHHGPTNKKLRVHLPVVVPPPVSTTQKFTTGCSSNALLMTPTKEEGGQGGAEQPQNKKQRRDAENDLQLCRLCVGDDHAIAEEGKCYIFDDSLRHEAFNNHASGSRIVLIFDIWHPDLSDQEIKFLHFLQASQMRRDRLLCERRRTQKEEEKEQEKEEDKDSEEDKEDVRDVRQKKKTEKEIKDEDDGETVLEQENDDFYSIIERASEIEPDPQELWSGTITPTPPPPPTTPTPPTPTIPTTPPTAPTAPTAPTPTAPTRLDNLNDQPNDQPITPPHVKEAALKEFYELKEAAQIRASLIREMEEEEKRIEALDKEPAKSPRATMYDAIAKKKAEAEQAQQIFEKHKSKRSNQGTPTTTTTTTTTTPTQNTTNTAEPPTRDLSAIRRLLKCKECASKDSGMCDSCRHVFLSKEWISLHPEWKAKDEVNKQNHTTSPQKSSTSKWPSAKKILALNHNKFSSERQLVEQLGLARDREQTLLEELDAYKRALRFARNFIELEHQGDTSKMKKLVQENKKLREGVKMYATQLSHVTNENQRLASALQEIVTGRTPRRGGGSTTGGISSPAGISSLIGGNDRPDHYSPYSNSGGRGGRKKPSSLLSTPPKRGFFTWSMGNGDQ